MDLIPVLDILAGVAVHARGGSRESYRPVQSVLTRDTGSALALARAYRRVLGATRCYVADLDALGGRPAQDALLSALADPAQGFGPGLLVDAGVTTAERGQAILNLGADHVVVGLETLDSFQNLASLVRTIGAGRVTFSLDLRHGKMVRWPEGAAPDRERSIPGLLAEVRAAGVGEILLLDLARIGAESGLDLDLVRQVRSLAPEATLLIGGGIRGAQDLVSLAEAGSDAVLVATAIHDGRLTAAAFRP